MLKRTVSGIMLVLLLANMLVVTFNVQPVRAGLGTIHIKADGSIDPPGAPILHVGDKYTLTSDVWFSKDNDGIVIERNDITIDGANHSIHGWDSQVFLYGVKLDGRQGVTVANLKIDFDTCIELDHSSNNRIIENRIDGINYGVYLAYSSDNTITGNVIEWSGVAAVRLAISTNNTISGNYVNGYECGVRLSESSSRNTVSGNNISSEWTGIEVSHSLDNSIRGNSVIGRELGNPNTQTGILVWQSSTGNTIFENNITNNDYGVRITYLSPSGNKVFHNNFVNNTQQVLTDAEVENIWDDGYPSGGNYWSDYTDVDLNNDSIWDHPYVIDANNTDRYPLVNPWASAPTDQPPTCMINLQKDGLDISRIGVSEFFDIDVEGSTDDNGILKVRFSNDDVRDGNPTGLWTQWYDWSISASDWDSTTKIRRWAFYTSGYKEVWAEVMDSSGQTARCSANMYVPAPALPVLISPLIISPLKDAYFVGDTLTAEFTIKNVGELSITLDKLTVGGRLNGWIQADGYPDFTYQSATLQAGETYQYTGSLTLTQNGNYHFFVAYYIANPTPEEKKLLDKNNWNTCIELGDGLTQSDRVKELIVFQEDVVPEEVSQLRDKITQELTRQATYPPYLLDPDGFKSSVATVWIEFTSWATQTHLTEKYDEMYNTGVDYQSLRIKALHDARVALDSGDFLGGQKYLRKSYTYDRLSMMSFSSAAQLFDGMAEAAETLAQGVKEGCEVARQLAELALKITNPAAAKTADYVFLGVDYAVDYMLLGQEEATKNLVIKIAVKTLFEEVNFDELGGKTLSDYTNNRIGKITFPILQKIFEDDEGSQFLASKIIQESGVAEETIVYWVQSLYNLFKKGVDLIQEKGKCPIDIRIHDSSGRTTGLSAGNVSHEIPMSMYYNQTITVFFPSDSYLYELEGKDSGTYGLEITQTQNGTTTHFNATDIPISADATHIFTIDWAALSRGEEGASVQVDSNGDGLYEYNFTSDSELSRFEYVTATTGHDLGITGIDSSKTIIGEGYTLPINTTVVNYGSYTEIFNITIYANTTMLASQTFTLTSGNSTTITYMWNTTAFAKGDYIINAVVDTLPNEAYTLDNSLTGGLVTVTIAGDVTSVTPEIPDYRVDMRDIGALCNKFMTKPSSPNWDPNYDINDDGVVNMRDIGIACNDFMKT